MKKTKLALLLIAALLAGVCIGFFVNSAIIRARIQKFSQMPANMPEHITQKLTERLKLNAEQREQVLAVFVAYDSRMQETRAKSQSMFDSLLAEMSIQIDQVLTPEQKEERLKLLAELDQRFRNTRALMRAFPPPAPKPGAAKPGK
jgi:Spy/CpxP family protein refolding chaperone